VIRWAWRLFRREWRQQLLIFALIAVAVAASVVGSAVATNDPPPSTAGFGTAQDLATYSGYDARTVSAIAELKARFGTVEIIERETLQVPGSTDAYQLVAQNPAGPFSGPMLALLSGHYPSGPTEVGVTRGVAASFGLAVGDHWRMGGVERTVVGIVRNPQNLLDEFALVVPGQVTDPTEVTALFDAPGVSPDAIGPTVETPASVARSNVFNPETISLAVLVLGMLLISLVSVGGFTVLAQRRLRSIGMLQATGATDGHVRLVVQANGAIVGVLGALAGFLLGLGLWIAYRPSLEQSSHHAIGVLALAWPVVGAAMLLATVAAYLAASRPARAVARVPIVAALSGRPAPPRQVRRTAIPGLVLVGGAFLLLGYSGGTNGGSGSGGLPELALGIMLLVPGLILLAPFLLSLTARFARRMPVAAGLALRDLARYRARSGSALAAISVAVLVAVMVVLGGAARYSNVLDYVGPNLAANQLVLHSAAEQQGPPPDAAGAPATQGAPSGAQGAPSTAPGSQTATGPRSTATPAEMAASAGQIAGALGARAIALETPAASLVGTQLGRTWHGAIYVATPELLAAFGITTAQVPPDADVLTSRPGLAGVTGVGLYYGSDGAKAVAQGGPDREASRPACTPANHCLPDPVISEVGALPTGTSAPNTVITEKAMSEFHITATTTDWLIQGSQPFTAAQVAGAQRAASAAQLTVESRNDIPSSDAVIGWATLFGIVLALGVLGMSVGLVRAETAGDLRTLTANGASGYTRRTLTAVTAGALGFLGALLGVVGGYIAMIGWLRTNSLNGGIAALGNVPVGQILLILLGMPAFAAVVGWLLGGREPAEGRRRIE
jgi:putative ABC transport system permease protein